ASIIPSTPLVRNRNSLPPGGERQRKLTNPPNQAPNTNEIATWHRAAIPKRTKNGVSSSVGAVRPPAPTNMTRYTMTADDPHAAAPTNMQTFWARLICAGVGGSGASSITSAHESQYPETRRGSCSSETRGAP